jgi:hypothetical protein
MGQPAGDALMPPPVVALLKFGRAKWNICIRAYFFSRKYPCILMAMARAFFTNMNFYPAGLLKSPP